MTIDICVVNYNTKELLRRLLTSLQTANKKISLESYNLFVADNGSNDGSSEMLQEMFESNDKVKLVFNDNIGYAAACNDLASLGTSEIIGLLNADVWLTADDVAAIQDRFDRHPEVAILGPKQRNEQGQIVHAGIAGQESAPYHRGWMTSDLKDERYRDFSEMVTVSGSAYFIKRSVWEALTRCRIYQRIAPGAKGAFLPTPHYFEETWTSYHARAHRYKVFYDGEVSIGHSWHASSAVGSSVDKQFLVSKKIFVNACVLHKIPHD